MFTDDTNLFNSNSNINELFENVNKELAKVADWCFANKLSINTSKTKYIHFFINKGVGVITRFKVFIILFLKRVTELKFLGVMIDKKI